MHILIAPNSFKQSLMASEVAECIKEGLLKSSLECSCECVPIGDGGDGTGDLLIEMLQGERIGTHVHDPLGRIIESSLGLVANGSTAIIEMANASGLRLLTEQELNPKRANSYGTGEQIKIALNRGVRKIVVTMGGSATIDGGTGILRALGARFLGEDGEEIMDFPEDLSQLDTIDTAGLDERLLACEIIVLCDVDNPLVGERGAAAIFGPQKGASSTDIALLEQSLKKLSEVIYKQTGVDISTIRYGGVAGGAAASLHALVDARLIKGIDYFLEVVGFRKKLKQADLVITGEGCLDDQTLLGKGPFGVASLAKLYNLPVIAFAGQVPLSGSEDFKPWFDAVIPIGHAPMNLNESFENAKFNLSRTAFMTGNLLNMQNGK